MTGANRHRAGKKHGLPRRALVAYVERGLMHATSRTMCSTAPLAC